MPIAIVHIVEADTTAPTEIDHLLNASGYRTRTYGSAEEILGTIKDSDLLGCIVIDMPARGAELPELFNRLSMAGSSLPVICLAGQNEVRAGVLAIKAGAEDVFAKPVDREEFIGAIDRAIAHHRLQNKRLGWVRAFEDRLQRLTKRERQVFELVVRGKLNKQIAFELGMTERTVKAHRRQVMEKTEMRSLVELVSRVERLGLTTEVI